MQPLIVCTGTTRMTTVAIGPASVTVATLENTASMMSVSDSDSDTNDSVTWNLFECSPPSHIL